eukprot:m.51498 g.51498  ORF g.51498 m.51498 type:complete len:88 (-) comp21456_c0_seq1:432-695(-)
MRGSASSVKIDSLRWETNPHGFKVDWEQMATSGLLSGSQRPTKSSLIALTRHQPLPSIHNSNYLKLDVNVLKLDASYKHIKGTDCHG